MFLFFCTSCGVKDTPKFEVDRSIESYVDSYKKKEELKKESKLPTNKK